MKLLTFEKYGKTSVGVSLDEGIVDLTRALNDTKSGVPADTMLDIVESGVDIDTIGGKSLSDLRSSSKLGNYVVTDFQWRVPMARPPKILALALNYQEHIDETNLEFYQEPIIFPKYSSNLLPHGGEIELPPFPQKVDEELELALVVGKDCRHIRASQAAEHIFGYTICNDVSARNRQRERGAMKQPYSYAKNFNSFAPMGPWIVTRAEIPDPGNLNMQVRVNGEVRRSGNTGKMIFSAYEVLAYCSDFLQMEAGDIISLGTYAGEKQIYAGDEIEMEIEKIGILRNTVVPAKAPWDNFTPEAETGPMVRE
jgi:2,4-diketo-3-deoxy-L-fuconate hydrolase